MSDGFRGADVVQLRDLAKAMQAASQKLNAQLGTFNAGVAGAPWPGPDAVRFRLDWKSSHSPALREAVLFLQKAATDLGRNASEQESASSAAGSGSAAGRPGKGSGGHSASAPGPTPRPADLAGKNPEQIREWWTGLTPAQQQEFIRAHPVEAGNTNGIPFDARVEANRANAQARLDALPANDPEPRFNPLLMDISAGQRFNEQHAAWEERQAARAYLQRVVEGKIQLAAYDPARNSIVEMIGAYSQDTSTVITYVPGTTTNEASFYGGGPQGIAHHLVQSDPTGGSVAFVYKGSEFPDGGLIEAFAVEAKSDDFVAASSPVLAGFQAAVELERPHDAQTVGIGHSWGLRNLTGSETNGAHYDRVIALSGAAMPPGWSPDPETAYSSYTYPDLLQSLELAGVVGDRYPMNEPAFDRHVYAPPGGTELSDAYSIDNHILIATTGPDNETALRDVRKEVYG